MNMFEHTYCCGIILNVAFQKQFSDAMVYISASQAQQELQQDQFDERLNKIAATHQQDVDGTVCTPTIQMTCNKYKIN